MLNVIKILFVFKKINVPMHCFFKPVVNPVQDRVHKWEVSLFLNFEILVMFILLVIDERTIHMYL